MKGQPQKRVAIGVGGIFHAERLSVALTKAGLDVSLFPTFPRFKIKQFDPKKTYPHVLSELVIRASQKVYQENWGDLLKMKMFGKWFAGQIQKRSASPFDIIIAWSSFGLEAFRANPRSMKILVRDSAHIETQFSILKQEFERHGKKLPDRSICIRRELEEYYLADKIIVLSQFAKRSFLEKGISESKLILLPLGADGSVFYQDTHRTLKTPLQVVYFGNLSLQKGIAYLLEAFEQIPPEKAKLTLIGSVLPEIKHLLPKLNRHRLLPHLDHRALSEELRQKNIFVFPSLHDGFGAVVPQALSSGLFTIATDHCGAADLITPGVNGEIIRAGSADAIRESVLKLCENLSWLKDRREAMATSHPNWSWDQYEKRVGEIFDELLGKSLRSKSA